MNKRSETDNELAHFQREKIPRIAPSEEENKGFIKRITK
jgi:hypothetical protein